MKSIFAGFSVVVLAFISVSLNAQVYTWVDENGKTHYSDKKPSGDVKVTVQEDVQGDLNVIESEAMTVDVDRLEADRKRREQADDRRKQENNEIAAKAWQAKNCYTQVENIHRGNANGTTRIIGTKEVKKCRKTIPRAYLPYLSDYGIE